MSFESFLATQPEPHYPHAFEPQNMVTTDRKWSTTAPNEATIMASGPTTSYSPYEPYSSSLRGPSFKTTQQAAIWTPKIGPSDSFSSKGARVYDVPVQPTASQVMPGYVPTPLFGDSAGDQNQTMTAMSGGGNAPAPPPPPPPPPPPSAGGRYLESVKAAKASQEATDAAIAADPNRSVVEYPEKQSVASLRSAIANKFNGSAPIKGTLSGPGQESTPIKEQVGNIEQAPLAPSNIDISIQPGQTQTYQSPPPAPQPYQAYQSLSNASKGLEDAAANIMSSVVGGAGIGFSRSDQSQESRILGKPLSVATGAPGRWTSATPPIRPPLPAGMKSPTPPSIPPAPTGFIMQPSPTISSSSLASSSFRFGGRPDNFARPYERTSIRGTDIPSGGFVTERRMSDGDYAIPYRETTTVTRRRTARKDDGNYKYDDIGPVDATGTPLSTREMVPGSDQHQWYKMMYKKMHQIDRKEDPSVLRYRLRDAVADRYMEERSPRRRLGSSTGSSPQRVGYKFAEFMADLPDEEAASGGMEFDRSYIPKPFHIFGERPSRTQDRDSYGRNRSKSANRYEAINTPPPYAVFPSQPLSSGPVEPPKADTAGPRPYQFQAPRPADHAPFPTTLQFDQEKRRIDQLSNRPQSAVAFGTRYDYQPTHQARGGIHEYAAADSTIRVQRRRELSPMRRDEARQWYHSVQTGGDAPLGGFRQPAPERRDSPHLYASTDVSSSRTTRVTDRLDFDIDEFSRLERELMQEDERRKRQLKELEDQKAKWQSYNVASAQFSPSGQHQPESDLRGVAKALFNFVAQSNREVSFRKGDLIKIRRQVDDHWYEGEVHGKVGILPINYVDLAATAIGDERATLTEVSTKMEGVAQVVYNFEGKNVNELPLRKGEFIVLTKKVDGNWLEGRNSFGRRGIFPSNYVKITSDPSSKTTDYVTAYVGSGQSQTYVRGDDPLKPLPNGSQLFEASRNIPSAPQAPIGATNRARATAPPQQISSTFGARNTDLVSKARELAQTVRKELGGGGSSGAEALDAALSAGQPDTFQALFPYKPQNPDELELKENDIVYVVERCDDGWYIGTSLRTGRFGTFPGNYVKRL